MSSKKLTDIDILRVLNCCYDKDEIILSFYETNKTKVDLTIQDIIDFINRLCETIERGDYTSYTAQVAKQCWHTQNSEYIEKLEAENERLTAKLESKSEDCRKCGERTQQVIGILQERLKTAKSETRKEFELQLEAEIISSDKYIREYDDSEVQKAYNKGLRTTLRLLKEETG